ncbi:MAG: hypothetical protein KGQ59_11165 [Bdellovibrionales bacterium]|nr:hypothetical protein [Bdellovibrionales bacterium]
MKSRSDYPRINLMPLERRNLSSALPSSLAPVILTVPLLIMLIFGLKQHVELKQSRQIRANLETQQVALAAKISEMGAQRNLLEKRSKQTSAIEQILKKKRVWSDHFKEMSMLSSKDVWLNELKASSDGAGKKEMILIGSGESSQAVSFFLQALEQTSFCRRVMMISSKRDNSTNPPQYRFRFRCPAMGTTDE